MIRRLCCAGALTVALLATSVPAAHAATSPSTWATKFCTALNKWQKQVTSESDKASAVLDVTSGSDLSAIRAQFVSFLKKDVASTKAAAKAIDKAGAPDVTNGKKIQNKVVAGFESTADVFSGAQTDAVALSTDDPVSFVADASKIEANIATAANTFTSVFSDVERLDKDGDLDSALQDAKACAFLFKSGS